MTFNEISYGVKKDGTAILGKELKSIVSISRARIVQQNKKLKPQVINAALMTALTVGALLWIRVFLPKRFTKSYAETMLGYRATESYKDDKRKAAASGDPYRFTGKDGTQFGESVVVQAPQDRPFVLSGKSMAYAMSGAKPNVSVMSDDSCRLAVTVPRGRINQTPQAASFSTIPGIEKARVAQAVISAFDSIILPAMVSGEIGPGYTKAQIERTVTKLSERKV
jgi:hypothetical protein